MQGVRRPRGAGSSGEGRQTVAGKDGQLDRLMRYAHILEQQTGRAVRPFRMDGYVNMLNRYGTSKDTTERYRYQAEPTVPDEQITMFYESNGLFSTIIDTPAEEAIKHGFTLEGLSDKRLEDFYRAALEELDWDETAMTAIKWCRLFGGAIAVMLINDGRGLDEPLDWRHIQSIDDIRVFDRSVITPDWQSMYRYDPREPFGSRGSRLGYPEYYDVYSRYGSFRVHDSRCLVFQNGVLPENTTNSIYQMWGVPEYVRISRAIRDAEVAHGSAVKLLDRSIQAVYKMKDLSAELATEEGENNVLRRLQTIDMARGLLNSIVIDNDGEEYDFRTFSFSGVSDVINTTCNYLSALTSIPQTILFGRSPAGMNSTGEGDMENFYNYVERIQRRMLKKNLRYLLSVIFQAGVYTGEVDEIPPIDIKFKPLWSLTEADEIALEQQKAAVQQTRAQTAQIYVEMQAVDPSEVRKKLADAGEFDIEKMLDEYTPEELEANAPKGEGGGEGGGPEGPAPGPAPGPEEPSPADGAPGGGGEAPGGDAPAGGEAPPETAPPAPETPEPEESGGQEPPFIKKEEQPGQNAGEVGKDSPPEPEPVKPGKPARDDAFTVGVITVKDGKILCAKRHNDTGYGLIGGPGGHGHPGETPKQAAAREMQEEFGITPEELFFIGRGPEEEAEEGNAPHIFLCTSFEGEPECADMELTDPRFLSMEELGQADLFPPFADSLDLLQSVLAGKPETGHYAMEEIESAVSEIKARLAARKQRQEIRAAVSEIKERRAGRKPPEPPPEPGGVPDAAGAAPAPGEKPAPEQETGPAGKEPAPVPEGVPEPKNPDSRPEPPEPVPGKRPLKKSRRKKKQEKKEQKRKPPEKPAGAPQSAGNGGNTSTQGRGENAPDAPPEALQGAENGTAGKKDRYGLTPELLEQVREAAQAVRDRLAEQTGEPEPERLTEKELDEIAEAVAFIRNRKAQEKIDRAAGRT